MSQNQIFARVQRVIAETLGVDVSTVQAHTRVKEDLGADSMQVVTIVIALDEEFDAEFNTDELPRESVTVGWVTEFVARTLARRA